MATWSDVRRIVYDLPDTGEHITKSGTTHWTVHGKLFVWERPLLKSELAALGPSAPTGPFVGVRTPDLELKAVLIASNPVEFFTTPHFDGYAAVLIVLREIRAAKLRDAIIESWLARAPKRAVTAFLATTKIRKQRT